MVSLKHCVRSSVDTDNEKTAPFFENLLTANCSVSDNLASLLTPCYATFLKHVIASHKKFPFLSSPRRRVRGDKVKLHAFLTPALDGGDRHHTPSRFTPGK